MSTLLDDKQTEDLVNHACAVECCATLDVPFILDDGEGGAVELDPHTLKIGLQFVFGLMGFTWPRVSQADLQQFMQDNDIVGNFDV